MTALELLAGFSTLMTLLGVYLISEKILISGWIINGLADLLWALWGILSQADGWESLVFLQTALFLIACNGLRKA